MGSLAGWLLGLNGKLGLSGWQWLFLLEGLPAALFSLVILKTLPNGPADAKWLTGEEKDLACRPVVLGADSSEAHLGDGASVLQALLSPKVWLIDAYFLCALVVKLCIWHFGACHFAGSHRVERDEGWISGGGIRRCSRAGDDPERFAFGPHPRAHTALRDPLPRDGRGVCDCGIGFGGLACRTVAGNRIHCVQFNAGGSRWLCRSSFLRDARPRGVGWRQ